MSVTAKFIADFSSFNSAVEKAEQKLTDFQVGASKVEKALQRMGDSLVGRKVVQEAALMAKSVEEIGGVSKLTANNLARVAATAKEAVDQLSRLGKDVPEGIARLARESAALVESNQRLAKESADSAKHLADLQNRLRGGSESATTFGDRLKSVNGLLGAFGVGLGVSAVVNFGKALFDSADALTKMSDKTGISITGLQRMQAVADGAGNTIEELTGAVSQMENRLASGDKSAVSALRKLGLSLEDLEHLNPENQFIAISDAIRGIEDPAKQTQIAMDLFGKAGAEILPSLKAGFDDVRNASVGMSEDTARALDQMGDDFTQLTRQVKGLAAEGLVALVRWNEAGWNPINKGINDARRSAEAFRAEIERMAKAIPQPKQTFAQAAPLNILADGSQAQHTIEESNRLLSDLTSHAKKVNDATRKAADDGLAKMRDRLREIDPGTVTFKVVSLMDAVKELRSEAPFKPLVEAVKALKTEAIPTFDQLRISLGKTGDQISAVERQGLPAFLDGLNKVGQTIDVVAPKARNLGDTFKALFSGDFGSFFKDLGGFFKNGLGDIGRGVLEGFGNIISGGITSLINKGLGALFSGVEKLFGKLFKTEGKQVNDLRDAFQSTFGTFDDMAKAAKRAGYDIKDLLDTKKVKDFEREMQKLKDAIDFQNEAMETLDETAKKYGFTLEELGPALQRQHLDQQAREIFKDWKILNAAGIDNVAIANRMSGAINDYFHAAMQTGMEIPIAMKPILDRMVQLGLLTDNAGNVITDLGEAGVTFAMSMSDGFKALIKEVQKLTEAIARGLGIALDNLPDEVPDPFDKWDVPTPRLPGGQIPKDFPTDLPDVYPMASGWSGRVTKPTLFLAAEAGPEEVAFSGANRSMSGARDADIIAELRALRYAIQDMPAPITVIGDEQVAASNLRGWKQNSSGLLSEARDLMGTA